MGGLFRKRTFLRKRHLDLSNLRQLRSLPRWPLESMSTYAFVVRRVLRIEACRRGAHPRRGFRAERLDHLASSSLVGPFDVGFEAISPARRSETESRSRRLSQYFDRQSACGIRVEPCSKCFVIDGGAARILVYREPSGFSRPTFNRPSGPRDQNTPGAASPWGSSRGCPGI